MAQPAAARRRNRRGRTRKPQALSLSVFHYMPEPWEPWERDWAELPADAISCVLHKLSLEELLLGGVAEVCRSWRRAAREEPELWRHIYVSCLLPDVPPFTKRQTLENIMRTALRLSAGQCRTFDGGEHLDDDLFMLLAKGAPSLKNLHLRSCSCIFWKGGFADGIKKLPLLEDLTLNHCYPDQQVLELVAQVCRCLKRFRLFEPKSCHSYRSKSGDNRNAFAIARMHGLRSLSLVGDDLGNEGLTAIIDSCPHLESELWRHIYVSCLLPDVPPFTKRQTLENIMRTALRLSAGQCRTFDGGEHLDDDLFMLLAKGAPSLKNLHLRSCSCIFWKGGFADGIKKLPLLEDLTLNHCYPDQQVLELVAQVCRCLKRFRLFEPKSCHSYRSKSGDNRNAFAIARMHGLRSLSLVGDDLGNEGLTAIIDSCPHLEYLYIRDCCKITMDGNLTAKCARITVHYYEYVLPSEPCSCYDSPLYWSNGYNDDGYDPDYDPDDYHDLFLYSYLGDEIDGADFEEHERILDVKSMRRYLS